MNKNTRIILLSSLFIIFLGFTIYSAITFLNIINEGEKCNAAKFDLDNQKFNIDNSNNPIQTVLLLTEYNKDLEMYNKECF